MTQQEAKLTVQVVRGPSREDLIFRGLCDGLLKSFSFEISEKRRDCYVQILGVRASNRTPNDLNPDLTLPGALFRSDHLWEIEGVIILKNWERKDSFLVFDRLVYESQGRSGFVFFTQEEVNLLFLS